MRYFLTFLFGAACGAGGTFLWLRKDIKKRLETVEKESELPFTMGGGDDSEKDEKASRSEISGLREHSEDDIQKGAKVKVDYHKIVNAVKSGEKPVAPIPVMPREDAPETESEPEEPNVVVASDIPEGTFEIDMDDFENDESNEKRRLVYFEGDHVMSTENGAVVTNPAMLVGSDWENYVGHYAKHTAFVRNPRLCTDYEIYVDEGLYSDEFGTEYRED